ncbi:MAG: cyclase family protein [Pseudomonadota bacterium]
MVFRKVIDLSLTLKNTMPEISPMHRKTAIEMTSTLEDDGIQRTMISLSCHAGTHMDAPQHIISGRTIDLIGVSECIGAAQKITLDKKDRDKIDDKDIPDTRDGEFMIINTGWYRRWPSKKYYSDYPFLTPDALDKIINLGFRGIGMDIPSLDRAGDNTFTNHKKTFRAGLIVVESLTNLDAIGDRFTFAAFPLKIEKAEASPCRAIGVL